MKKIFKISLISSIVLLTACESMKEIIPPAWQSMDAFKKSLVDFNEQSKGGTIAEPVLIADTMQKPSLSLLTKNKITKGKTSISDDTKIEVSPKVSYKYHYIQRSTTQYTPGYEQYHRTTIPEIKQTPETIEFKLVITNNLQHSINSADFLAALFINGNRKKVEILNSGRIIPGTSESLIISGPKFSNFKQGDKVSLRLYDVTTNTNQAGAASRKDTFTWDMVYNSVQVKLDKPLYTKTEKVFISSTEAQNAKLGYYTSDIKGQNAKRWDPQSKQWYAPRQWDRLKRNESIVSPEGTSTQKIGEI